MPKPNRKKPAAGKAGVVRRSTCPVACSLDVVGDRWTMLVVRDLMTGRTRFREFMASPEAIPTNILSDRLKRLLQHGVVKQIPAADGTKRFAYQLTRKGRALQQVLGALRDWGLAHDKSTRAIRQPKTA